MTLDPRLVLFEVLNFLLLVAVLARFLFRPLRALLQARQEEMARERRELEAGRAEASAAREEHLALTRALEAEREQLRREATDRAEAEAARLTDEARRERLTLLQQAEEEAALLRGRSVAALRGELARLGVEAAERVLRGLGEAGVSARYARLGAERLQAELGPELPGRVLVEFDPRAEEAPVRDAVRGVLGQVELDLRPEPALVGGVRLSAGDRVVEASAGAALLAWLERAAAGASP